jgi:hypothetical protein
MLIIYGTCSAISHGKPFVLYITLVIIIIIIIIIIISSSSSSSSILVWFTFPINGCI